MEEGRGLLRCGLQGFVSFGFTRPARSELSRGRTSRLRLRTGGINGLAGTWVQSRRSLSQAIGETQQQTRPDTAPFYRSARHRIWAMEDTNVELRQYLFKRGGLFAVNKPKGITSFDIVHAVRKTIATDLDTRKIHFKRLRDIKCGHGGTLDPLATGVIVVALGPATKQLPHMLQGKKTYLGEGLLGAETDSYDSEGAVKGEAKYDHVTFNSIEAILPKFTGQITQVPPIFSAKRINGERAYDLARKGKEFTMKPKEVVVERLTLESFESPYFWIQVKCGGGTYIRSIIHDMGKAVDSAAHMTNLTRLRHGPFGEDDAIELEGITADKIFGAISAGKSKVGRYLDLFRDKEKPV